MKLRAILEIKYDPNGTSQQELSSILQQNFDGMIQKGDITGETSATIKTHNLNIEDPDKKAFFSWSIEDILTQAETLNIELTEQEAIKILANIKRKHDASIGINWDVIDTHIDMFKKEH